jgi:Zn-dependent protease
MSFFNMLNIPLGRWLGVEATLHWTFTLAMLLVGFLSPKFLLLVLGVFVLVLLHEYGHIFAGQKVGLHVERVWLTPLGGMAVFQHIGTNPKQEFIMTAGGPLVNVALILPIYALSSIPYFNQLAFYNMVLLVFNLLPAFPSDGGRLLRSSLNFLMKDYVKATNIACYTSYITCMFFCIVGMFFLNFTLVIIAFFLFMCARAEQERAEEVVWHEQATGSTEESSEILMNMQKRIVSFRKKQ